MAPTRLTSSTSTSVNSSTKKNRGENIRQTNVFGPLCRQVFCLALSLVLITLGARFFGALNLEIVDEAAQQQRNPDILLPDRQQQQIVMSAAARILVYGGRGALGSTIVSHLKSKNYWVGSIDLVSNEEADANFLVPADASWMDQEKTILKEVSDVLQEQTLDAILCVAGGWAGGNAAHADFVKNSDLMWKQSVWSSALAAALAAKHLKEGGLLTLTGAKAALEGTPGMIGYGMAKAAVHQLVKSLAASDGGLPANSSVFAILPVTLDTPMNRKWMPKADHSSWTPLEFVADLMERWTVGEDRPNNGSLVQLITENGVTKLVTA